ncbi:MAG: Flp pilus assembly complex ATPase component TadA [Acidobacteriota bacterium]|nr:Flp pilus assembly complex ATPase component TadA [Acidobacteriota bacterium]
MSFDLILPFLKPIESLLLNPTISEIMVNPDSSVWMEEAEQKQLLKGVRFEQGTLETALEVIANKFGKRLNADSPILNLRLPDGSRLAALIPPVVNPGPLLTIRKFTSRNFGIQDLIDRQMLSDVQANQLAAAIRRGDNILIAGGTGTGKTTLLNVLADFIPDEERILIIEDTAELHIRKAHVISAEAQLDTHKSTITFDDLLRSVLRHRPDRILVGEVRGAEARTLLDAMNTGHRGTLATIHANSAGEALRRLGSLALRGDAHVDVSGIREEVERCLDMVVHIVRVNGRRVVREINEVGSEGRQP